MFALTANDFILTLAGVIVFLGVIAFVVGLFTLAFKVNNGDFNEITSSSAKLAEKGLTDDVFRHGQWHFRDSEIHYRNDQDESRSRDLHDHRLLCFVRRGLLSGRKNLITQLHC